MTQVLAVDTKADKLIERPPTRLRFGLVTKAEPQGTSCWRYSGVAYSVGLTTVDNSEASQVNPPTSVGSTRTNSPSMSWTETEHWEF